MSPHETGGPMTMALPFRQKAMVKTKIHIYIFCAISGAYSLVTDDQMIYSILYVEMFKRPQNSIK
jgi:hypothetical protein